MRPGRSSQTKATSRTNNQGNQTGEYSPAKVILTGRLGNHRKKALDGFSQVAAGSNFSTDAVCVSFLKLIFGDSQRGNCMRDVPKAIND